MPVVALDDRRWRRLRHAYGTAEDIPDLLRALARGDDRDEDPSDDDGVWFQLWSALCHQGDVDTASYAAVPHVVAIAATRPIDEQVDFWAFVGAVAGSTNGPPVPSDLRDAFDAAIDEALARASACLVPGVDEDEARALVHAVAELRRWRAVAEAVEALGDGELNPACPGCGVDLYVTVTERPFVVHDQDPVRRRKHRTTKAEALEARRELVELAGLARRAGHDALAADLEALDAAVTCPACGHRFPLLGEADAA